MVRNFRHPQLVLALLLLSPAFASAYDCPCNSFGSGSSSGRFHGNFGDTFDQCVPVTADTAFDQAYDAFRRRNYDAAIMLANRGLEDRQDARLFLIKGVSELHLGLCDEAQRTIEQYRHAVKAGNLVGLDPARERVNGPMRVRFQQLLKYQERRDGGYETSAEPMNMQPSRPVGPPTPGVTLKPRTKQRSERGVMSGS